MDPTALRAVCFASPLGEAANRWHSINATFFSEAFLVGGEGELREAELRIECWITALQEVSSAQRLDLTVALLHCLSRVRAVARTKLRLELSILVGVMVIMVPLDSP